MKYARLFEPCRIGNVELANRLVMPPMTSNFAREGLPTDCMIDYYAERARGGVGLIVVEDSIVASSTGRHTYNDLLIDDDKYIPSLHKMVRAIKNGGAKVTVHLSHAGRRAVPTVVGRDVSSVAPSPLPDLFLGSFVPRELTIDEIEGIEEKFADAALRAREAGFDLLALHGAHGYLINQFLSPASNHRDDEYGGDLTRRLHFLLQIIRKIKAKVGDDYPIMVRIPGDERADGGHTINDCKEIAHRLEAAGVHCISVSTDGGVNPSRLDVPPQTAPMRVPRACLVSLAAAIKQAVSVPVMTANRIVTPQLAEEILEQGKADLIGIGRALIADPEWPKKAKEGREEHIRYCMYCQYCLYTVYKRGDLRCAVNVAAGRETECKIFPSTKQKKVYIAGGGPAGLEAARVAALRGHTVHLFEKDKLGGQVNLACIPPGKDEMKLFLTFEERQLHQLGVAVEFKELTPDIVMQEKPDAVVVATGSQPMLPSLPGIEKSNVTTAWQVLKGETTPGNRVVVLGGGEVGAETAEYLAVKGAHKVTIVEMLNEIAADVYTYSRQLLLISLDNLGVKVLTRTTAKEITDTGIVVKSDGKQELIKADTVVVALGSQPNRELAEQLKELVVELYVVGDCAEARQIPMAVEEGFQAAQKL